MSYQSLQEETLLVLATSTGSDKEPLTQRCKGWNFIFTAASVTTGATIEIQAGFGASSWVTIHTETITADGTTIAQSDEGVFKKLRANITSHTDGSYNVFAQGCLGN
jgi:hypothetical protein